MADGQLAAPLAALLAGKRIAVPPGEPKATLLDPLGDGAVVRFLSASVPLNQRASIELVLKAQRGSSHEMAQSLLFAAGVRGTASLAAAVTHLIDTALRLGSNTTLNDAQLVTLLKLIDEALAPAFRSMSLDEQSVAYDALLIEAGVITAFKAFDPGSVAPMATACLVRFKLR